MGFLNQEKLLSCNFHINSWELKTHAHCLNTVKGECNCTVALRFNYDDAMASVPAKPYAIT